MTKANLGGICWAGSMQRGRDVYHPECALWLCLLSVITERVEEQVKSAVVTAWNGFYGY